MADDFKGDYGALGQVYSLPKEGYLSEDLSERPTISIGTTNKVRKPFLPSGELNIPTIAAANELAQRGQLTNTEDNLRQRNVTAVSEKLSKLGISPRRSRKLTETFIGGPSSPLLGAGLIDLTPFGIPYLINEAGIGFEKAEKPTDYIVPTIEAALGVGEALIIGKVLAAPAKVFLKSLSSKLPAAGALGDVAVTPKGIIHQAGSGATQRANTVPSYTKASTVAEIKEGDTVLDYGAGLGLGSDELRKTGANVESLELDTSRWVSDTPVTYTDSSAINKNV